MLEYFGYKQYKKYKTEKEAKEAAATDGNDAATQHPASRPSPSRRQTSSRSLSPAGSAATDRTKGGPAPVLDRKDEAFFRRILSDPDAEDSDDEHLRPPLPPRSKTPEYTWESDESRRTAPLKEEPPKKAATVAVDPKADGKKPNKIAFLFSKVRGGDDKDKQLAPVKPTAVPAEEEAREKDDLSRVLEDLNLSAKNNKAIPLSAESSELVQQFTLALKDLVNGVPTAVDDIKRLVEDKDGTIKKSFDKLPNGMKKLVTNLPDKFTASLGPEVLAAAAKSQGIHQAEVGAEETVKGAAKRMFNPSNLSDLVTKPGAVVGMLKAIVNALKLRWPAFIGTNAIISVALFLLLFVLWYCHKRGREERIKRENAPEIIDGSGRIEELPDDPALPGPSRSRTEPVHSDRPRSQRSERSRRSGRAGSGRTTPARRASPPPPDSPRRRATRK
ncbi:hypothetical protein CkaCkLH20_01031 [Colletotrichum karsti]|uniref:Ring-like domain-containing protein n=1 Tax=Colletotrichum karsti TaxID=1095194 RepID=A0A9P6IFP1_9PEZI|nr:uncharacterized protein CkaCkLH20_01031 [Colletotrichum karsti]KAF9881885.1 hypothetical protein CkaCkLH20_01031 [Colletotrichum karsti]